MEFKVTDLTIDWLNEDDLIDPIEKNRISASIIEIAWDAACNDDTSDLMNQLTEGYGWCIASITYQPILQLLSVRLVT